VVWKETSILCEGGNSSFIGGREWITRRPKSTGEKKRGKLKRPRDATETAGLVWKKVKKKDGVEAAQNTKSCGGPQVVCAGLRHWAQRLLLPRFKKRQYE